MKAEVGNLGRLEGSFQSRSKLCSIFPSGEQNTSGPSTFCSRVRHEGLACIAIQNGPSALAGLVTPLRCGARQHDAQGELGLSSMPTGLLSLAVTTVAICSGVGATFCGPFRDSGAKRLGLGMG
jgi:hypothetical protein